MARTAAARMNGLEGRELSGLELLSLLDNAPLAYADPFKNVRPANLPAFPVPTMQGTRFVVASPPDDRQIQLWMLGRLARIILLRDFLSSVRSADSRDDILRALEIADGQINSFYSSVEITQPELPRLVLPEDDSLLPDDSSRGSD